MTDKKKEEYFYIECETCEYWKVNSGYYLPCEHKYFYEELPEEYNICILIDKKRG